MSRLVAAISAVGRRKRRLCSGWTRLVPPERVPEKDPTADGDARQVRLGGGRDLGESGDGILDRHDRLPD
jgi:hypothetical protein